MHAPVRTRRQALVLITLSVLALGALGAVAPAAAGGSGMPQGSQAKIYRMQAQQNRQIGSRQAAASAPTPAAGSGYALDPVAGGTGNLSIGSLGQSDTRNLRELNTVVNGDIININRR